MSAPDSSHAPLGREALYRAVDFAIGEGGWRPEDLDALLRGCARDAKGFPVACCERCGRREWEDGLILTETIDAGEDGSPPILSGGVCPICIAKGGR